MNNLSLNFFGEQVEVKLPETLASLRQNISEKFLFSPSDAAELVISYAKDLGKKIIETENDFKEFIKSKVFKVDLDVDQNSQIFQKSLIKLQTEKEANKKELDNLISQSQELKNKKKQKNSEAKKKIDELKEKKKEVEKKKKEAVAQFNQEIQQLKTEICNIKKQTELEKQKIVKKENELNKSIDEIKIKLGIPVEKKEKKEKKQKNKIKPKLKSKRQQKAPFFNILKDNLDKMTNKVSDLIKNQIENNDLKENEKKLLDTIKDWTDYIKNNTEKITNNLSKKYEEYKKIFNPEDYKETHWNYICDGCGMAPIKGVRYHCKECDDFDFCEKCHNEKKDEHKHDFLSIEKSVFKIPARLLRSHRKICEKNKKNEKNVHFGVTCDGCGVYPIVGCRYKCSICPNFDFCENCEKKLYKEHSHPMVQIPNPDIKLYSIKCSLKEEFKMGNSNPHSEIIHDGITCDGCWAKNIVGNRYKCSVCTNFDYCEKCLKEHTSTHQHPFIKIYHPKMKLASIKAVVDENCPTYIPEVKIIPNYSPLEKEEKTEKLRAQKKNKVNRHEGPVHEDVTCDGCGMYPVVGCRYKCAICPNFDFCEKCEKKCYKEHSHPMIQIPSPKMKLLKVKCNLKEKFKMKNIKENMDIIHDGVSCDGCGSKCIVGNRYKCTICENLDYCEKCLKNNASKHKHPFIKIYHPKMKLASIKVVVEEDCPVYDNSNSKKVKDQKNCKKNVEKNEKPVHEGINCDGCGVKDIVGCRYKCAVCQNFDYCEECEEKLSNKHLHPFIKIYNPEMKIASIKCVVRDDCPIYKKEN